MTEEKQEWILEIKIKVDDKDETKCAEDCPLWKCCPNRNTKIPLYKRTEYCLSNSYTK